MNLSIDIDPAYQARRAIGSKCGVIRVMEFDTYERPRHGNPVVTTSVDPSSVAEVLPNDAEELPSLGVCGKGTNERDALVRTVGEFLDRYCQLWPVDTWGVDTTRASYESIRRSRTVVDIDHVDVFGDEDLEDVGAVRLRDETRVRWIEGTDLSTMEGIYLPAQVVSPVEPLEAPPRYYFPTSNGSACGGSLEFALTHALYEFVERDALMYSWYTETPPDRVALGDHARIESLKEQLEDDFLRFEVLYFDSPVDVHTVGVAVVDERERAPKFVLAGAANLEFQEATRSALIEARQLQVAAKDFTAFREFPGDVAPGDVTNLRDNAHYYMQPDNFDEVSFLLDGPERRIDASSGSSYGSTRRELLDLLDALRESDCTPVCFDLTTADAAELGMNVAKVHVPELLDLPLPGVPPEYHPRFAGVEITDSGHPFG